MGTRFGSEDRSAKTLNLDFWLTIGRGTPQGNWPTAPSVKVSAGYPSLARNERAMNLKIKLPLALFEAPSLKAEIAVEAPTEAVSIDIAAVSEAVRQVIGMDVDVDVQIVVPEAE